MGVEQRHALNLKVLQGNLDYLPRKRTEIKPPF